MADRDQPQDRRRGPRGGVTTRSRSGMTKKNLWMPDEMAEELRRRAEDDGVSEAEVARLFIRRGLRDSESCQNA